MTTSMYKQFSTDGDVEKDGVWLEYDGFRVKVARAGGANRKFAKTAETLTKPVRRALQTGTLSDERGTEIAYQIYAKSVILAWETEVDGEYVSGIEQPDGTIAPFSPNAVLDVFRALPDLFMDIQSQAQNLALFKTEIMAEEVGNSQTSSSTV